MTETHPGAEEAAPDGRRPAEPPRDFFPLRLVMNDTGLAILCARPELVVGRHSGSDIRLPLPDVSRRHCRLHFHNGGWGLTDLGSTNGVYVNGRRVTRAELRPGDELRLGGFTFEVVYPEDRAAPPPRQPAEPGMLRSIAESLPAGPDARRSS
ncbi:MAG TPA: FHA domain-containing protein [Gemmataceae bacterium]